MARFVLRFCKGEEVRWLGHLDLMRSIERVLMRTDVPVAYTQGFNPRPRLSILSALSLGVTGGSEIMTLDMDQDIEPDVLAKRLNEQMPPGLAVIEAEVIHEGVRKFVRVTGSEYLVAIACDEPLSESILSDAVTKLLEQKEITVVRAKKDRSKPVDLRPGIESIDITDSSTLVIRIQHGEGFTPKPTEIVEALSAYAPGLKIERVHRVKLY